MIQIIKCKDYEEMSIRAAELAADSIRANPKALVSFPGGETPLGMVQQFVNMVNTDQLDISQAGYVTLDEWVGLSESDEGSCGWFNRENLFSQLKKPFARTHLINGMAVDVEAECQALNAFISEYGPLDVSLLGIGLNGHLGFNEEGVDFSQKAHVVPLSETTKRVMTKYFGNRSHPEFGITQGICQIMDARKIILMANGSHKAEILKLALQGEITTKVPASVLQNHPYCYVVVDQAAASML